jgi:hypothetical protein
MHSGWQRITPPRTDMALDFCIEPDQLRAALREIEAAEANGFNYCLAVFRIAHAGVDIVNCRAAYSDLLERAHPIDANRNWGRFQHLSKRFKYQDGKLVPLEQWKE